MQAKKGDKVKVHYTLKLNGDEIVESSKDSLPLSFTIGEGQMIPGFENGVIGMAPGETKTINIPCAEGYGERDEKLVFTFDKNRAPADFDPQIGQTIKMHRPDGKSFAVTVLERTETGFLMDGNHPMAGKDLTFELELIEIES